MKLIELEPRFMRRKDDTHFSDVETVEEADGIIFLCPVCFKAHDGPIGTHEIICWRPNVPQTTSPTPGRWEFEGKSFDDLSLVAGSSSILLNGPGCGAHFFIRNGEVIGA